VHIFEQSKDQAVTPTSNRRHTLVGRGPDGNERITALTGAILIALLAVIGITILRIGQLLWLHLFVGMLLLGPLAVKLASTGYRFVRYYTGTPSYRTKGPPEALMRLIAPVVVASSVLVFTSGIVLVIAGPGARSQFLLLHKASFIIWLPFTGLHVLGHLRAVGRAMRRERRRVDGPAVRGGRARGWVVVAAGRLIGLGVALAMIPEFSPWTAHVALLNADH
jgi:hypothetical protein